MPYLSAKVTGNCVLTAGEIPAHSVSYDVTHPVYAVVQERLQTARLFFDETEKDFFLLELQIFKFKGE